MAKTNSSKSEKIGKTIHENTNKRVGINLYGPKKRRKFTPFYFRKSPQIKNKGTTTSTWGRTFYYTLKRKYIYRYIYSSTRRGNFFELFTKTVNLFDLVKNRT